MALADSKTKIKKTEKKNSKIKFKQKMNKKIKKNKPKKLNRQFLGQK